MFSAKSKPSAISTIGGEFNKKQDSIPVPDNNSSHEIVKSLMYEVV
jgi:hypothetical protein